ncbi:hypothetical protein PG993_006303 [Apiospora rasikravindrae]|uniref:Uncharacterized protein n=1 Tax=Apiospora rasikravindrae TaxID=990691 RepID=A0ABR1T747_9PEZI
MPLSTELNLPLERGPQALRQSSSPVIVVLYRLRNPRPSASACAAFLLGIGHGLSGGTLVRR